MDSKQGTDGAISFRNTFSLRKIKNTELNPFLPCFARGPLDDEHDVRHDGHLQRTLQSEWFRSLKKTMHDLKKGPFAPSSWEPYTADKPVHRKIIDCSSSIVFVSGLGFLHRILAWTPWPIMQPIRNSHGNNWGENCPKAPNYSTREAFIFFLVYENFTLFWCFGSDIKRTPNPTQERLWARLIFTVWICGLNCDNLHNITRPKIGSLKEKQWVMRGHWARL